MRGSVFEHVEVQGGDKFQKQNAKMLKVTLNGDEVITKTGAMVAYQGDVKFDRQGGGLQRFAKQLATGESIKVMRTYGRGEVFFADAAADVHLLYLENDGLVVNSPNLLAFESTLNWDIGVMRNVGGATGTVYNITLNGTGWVAVTTSGSPMMLTISMQSQSYADLDAVVAWTLGMRVSFEAPVKTSPYAQMKSGEGWQMSFEGQHGYVVLQPSEIGGFATVGVKEAMGLLKTMHGRGNTGLQGGGFGGGAGGQQGGFGGGFGGGAGGLPGNLGGLLGGLGGLGGPRR
jgi:uncharacterized protein (AIM24 family)